MLFNDKTKLKSFGKIILTILSVCSGVAAIISVPVALLAWKKPAVVDPEKIECNVSRYNGNEVADFYNGEIINKDTMHMNGLKINSKFTVGKKYKIDASSRDLIKEKKANKDGLYIEMDRLSSGNNLEFNLIVDKQCKIYDFIQITWGSKGEYKCVPSENKSDVTKGIKAKEFFDANVGSKLSQKSRKMWVDNNSKSIGR